MRRYAILSGNIVENIVLYLPGVPWSRLGNPEVIDVTDVAEVNLGCRLVDGVWMPPDVDADGNYVIPPIVDSE
jgi:hypothetical protein